ncbi:hypothetical protein DM01DRAFT_1333581 [Hesseltinella vesiculosa]|uniref:Uncharacterized protein n=1 Tax=Hesseltinella vesiculosa TaxID=101127 RepID=A0A1X2GQG8_9FUNG|nr:hypothetical protein DM01DRAFT_1333581 [Hesseltinella vesiculosa]
MPRNAHLIDQATTRLRRRMLEDQLSEVDEEFQFLKRYMGEIQTHLSTTKDQVQQLTQLDLASQNHRMNLLEWQLKQYQTMLSAMQCNMTKGPLSRAPPDRHMTQTAPSPEPRPLSPPLWTSIENDSRLSRQAKRGSVMSRESSMSYVSSIFSTGPASYASSQCSDAATDCTAFSDEEKPYCPDNLEVTMAYLEQLEALPGDEDDQQLLDDLAFLLDYPRDQPAPPTSKQYSHVSNRQRVHPSQALCEKNAGHSAWEWCRFLSVVSASYAISLLKGPDDLDL